MLLEPFEIYCECDVVKFNVVISIYNRKIIKRRAVEKLNKVIKENERVKEEFIALEKLKRKEKRKGVKISDEQKQKISKSMKEYHLQKGHVTPKVYCEKFNEEYREKIRRRFARTCVMCGIGEEEYMEKQVNEGKQPNRLHVHHVNYEKNCMCEGITCECVPLCNSC